MKHILFLALTSIGFASTVTINCTAIAGPGFTPVSGGSGYSIANGTGSGLISCPAITSPFVHYFYDYRVLATIDYQGGPFGTSSGTEVSQVLQISGGVLNGTSLLAIISGGNSSNTVVPPVPFQIGPVQPIYLFYPSFTVHVGSWVSAGGPVAGSSGQVVIMYEVIPEPAIYAMVSSGLLGFVLARNRISKK